jgi:hypothetical protein
MPLPFDCGVQDVDDGNSRCYVANANAHVVAVAIAFVSV